MPPRKQVGPTLTKDTAKKLVRKAALGRIAAAAKPKPATIARIKAAAAKPAKDYMRMRRKAAERFMAANQASPIVSGAALTSKRKPIHTNADNLDRTYSRYTLQDGSSYILHKDAMALLEAWEFRPIWARAKDERAEWVGDMAAAGAAHQSIADRVSTTSPVGGPGIDSLVTLKKLASQATRSDPVNHPAHYGGADNVYEAIKVIEAWGLGFCLGNTVKYISRAGKKGAETELQDLSKASWYLQRRIEELKI